MLVSWNPICVLLVGGTLSCGRLHYGMHDEESLDYDAQEVDCNATATCPGRYDAATPLIDAAGVDTRNVLGMPITLSASVSAFGQSVTTREDWTLLGLSEAAHGVQVVRTEPADSPTLASLIRTDSGPAALDPTRNDVLGITWVDNYAYLATYLGGLVIVEMTDPKAPEIVGALDLESQSWAVAVLGSYAYVANWAGLKVVDVSNPSSPVLVTTFALNGQTQDVHIANGTLYAASQTYVQVVDLTNPTAPSLVGELAYDGTAMEVWSRGDGFAYVADRTKHGLAVIDATRPDTPEVVWTLATDACSCLSVDGDASRLLVGITGCDAATGLQLYEIDEPSVPKLLSEALTANPIEVSLYNNLAVSSQPNGSLMTFGLQQE